MNDQQKIIEVIKNRTKDIFPIINFDYQHENVFIFDFTENNKELLKVDFANIKEFSNYVFGKMEENDSPVAIGRYNENRLIYASEMFKSDVSPRTIHLGIDLWAKAGTSVFAPLEAKVHSFKNNAVNGDYGPAIILEHQFNNVIFYSLYGHLSLDSIEHLQEGQHIPGGQEIARIGNYPTNGNWPPHLHFQIITDIQDKKGDFCGVASLEDRERLLEICPDPNLILNIESLN
jgi:peptidoglycan LD-endopeptidase LytH